MSGVINPSVCAICKLQRVHQQVCFTDDMIFDNPFYCLHCQRVEAHRAEVIQGFNGATLLWNGYDFPAEGLFCSPWSSGTGAETNPPAAQHSTSGCVLFFLFVFEDSHHILCLEDDGTVAGFE